jgi:hypothetical protein
MYLNERTGLARVIEIKRRKQERMQVLWKLKLICNFGGPLCEKEYKIRQEIEYFLGPLQRPVQVRNPEA